MNELWTATEAGDASTVRKLLHRSPDLDVNQPNKRDSPRWTLLHLACFEGHLEIIKLLLKRPNIDVNQLNGAGRTGLFMAVWGGRLSAVWLMLRDPRVDVNLHDSRHRTPFWVAAHKDHDAMAKHLLASDRLVDVGKQGMDVAGIWRGLLDAGSLVRRPLMAKLARRYFANPGKTRLELRREVFEVFAEELFAVTVLHCDDFLRVKRSRGGKEVEAEEEAEDDEAEEDEAEEDEAEEGSGEEDEGSKRIFVMLGKLPIELQMILCFRIYGSTRGNVTTVQFERRCREVVARLVKEDT